MVWIENLQARAESIGLRAQLREQPPDGWYQIRNAADDETEILLYEEIGGWFGATAEALIDELSEIKTGRITVRLNSPGGSVFEGIAIANALRAHPATVTTRVDGIAASIASVIAMAGDRLVMMPNTQLMIHDASGLCMGNASDMRELADLLDLQSDNIADVYAARAGGSRDEWRQRMTAETWYLADEAVKAGLADEVAQLPRKGREEEPAEPEPAMAARWDLSAFRYAGRQAAPAPLAAKTDGEREPLATGGVLTRDVNLDADSHALVAAVLRRDTAARADTHVSTTPDPPPDNTTTGEAPATTTVTGSTHEDEPEGGPADTWADITARLTAQARPGWSSLVAHLTNPTPSSATTTTPEEAQ
ncbi:Clp protease ClpP [Streptomyces klenkii]|uniref:ATP-dependent Clp protease proteolytic subunit n=1 Tax=Streptomyces klenkii TaxID=1420899 RepID=A0A3B0AMH7_9ACTN|nr:head maturation protease, ClpP-related [Streptomyces klenkii]RKN61868.1 Clp protease ClpP [Streptomyces klenkii]